jgi:hypothetical protein
VGELQVGHPRAVPVPPRRRLHKHAARPYTTNSSSNYSNGQSRAARDSDVVD